MIRDNEIHNFNEEHKNNELLDKYTTTTTTDVNNNTTNRIYKPGTKIPMKSTTTTTTNTTASNSIYNVSKESNDSNFTTKSASTTATTADKKNKNNNRITVLTFNSFVTDYRLALYSESIQSVPLTSSSTSSIVIPEFLIEVEMRTKEIVPGYNPVLQYLGYNVVLKHHKWKIWKRFNEFMELHEEILRVSLYYIIFYFICLI